MNFAEIAKCWNDAVKSGLPDNKYQVVKTLVCAKRYWFGACCQSVADDSAQTNTKGMEEAIKPLLCYVQETPRFQALHDPMVAHLHAAAFAKAIRQLDETLQKVAPGSLMSSPQVSEVLGKVVSAATTALGVPGMTAAQQQMAAQSLLNQTWLVRPADLGGWFERILDLKWPCRPLVPLALMRDLVRALLGLPEIESVRMTTVCFAVVADGAASGSAAQVLQFQFERLPSRGGQLFMSAEQALLEMDQDFRQILDGVPRAVETLRLDGPDPAPDNDVRIRILALDGQAIFAPLKGDSATGAAARGLWFLHSGRIPDDDLIVLAKVNSAGQVEGVDDETIPDKVEAVALTHRFTKILVSQSNKQHAVTARDKLVQGGVLKPHTLAIECL